MEIRRKDSFLWGRAPIKLLPGHRKQQELIQSRGSGTNDDTQKPNLDVDRVTPDERSADVREQNKNVMRCRKFLRGKKKFNMDPKKGVQYLVENSLLEKKPPSVATFLYKEEGLNKTAIGNFLGEREEFHLETLKAFVDLHEFSDLNLVQALRQFLWSFRLPGEAQKIDRMMEAFASRYCDCNPGVFQSTDTCYILSFAVIMLNTSLHNPNVKDKPSLHCFISMNRGINNGANLPAELLTKLYASIRSEPFKIPEDDGNDLTLTFFNPDREGWLLKMGGRVKTWKRRWFILTDSCLYYFEYTTDKDPIGIIPLENLCVRTLQDAGKPYCLELFNPNGQKIKACKTENKGRVVQGKHQSYKLSAASQNERDSWIDAISTSVTRNPFSDLMSLRRKKVISPAPSPPPPQS
ncbi:cytohesin-2-like [Nelusetta ayraudi]|uniref:cytohesin-2-like n=1 Tax=Nelusetta ayraudi TaxID=303726 RepID=UPI003F712A5B